MVVVGGCTQLRRHHDWGRAQLALVERPGVGIVVGVVDGLTRAAPLSGSVGSLWVARSLVIFAVRTPRGLWLAGVVIAVVGGARNSGLKLAERATQWRRRCHRGWSYTRLMSHVGGAS